MYVSVDIDLEDLEDDIKRKYCNEANCLKHKRNGYALKEFVDNLDKDIYVYHRTDIKPEAILWELKKFI